MLDAAYFVAALLALVAGLAGNRVAWPLLGSFAFCQFVRWQALPFDLNLWLTVDYTVLIGVGIVLLNEARKGERLTRCDMAVLLLFVPGFGAYAMEAAAAYYVSSLAAIAQLLLTFPAFCTAERRKRLREHQDRWDEFDLRVRA